ncbi:hypothetical protein B0T22DRAFT_536274 [Podospora appendiculata]|uniref:AAA+ ATPase domain-containing protein n=1 Tax=Podospora appendiculata TaxID=314037 RepID=A0AAE0XAZ7_9PEZI|nr:hypothetical protein B0T22DRAFT_536274 [Podospora appendiculata]
MIQINTGGCWQSSRYIKSSVAGGTIELTGGDLENEARKTLLEFERRKKPTKGIFALIYGLLQQNCAAIDVFVQQQPAVASIVWGGVRVILRVIIDKEEASKLAGEGILEIVCQLGRWKEGADIYPGKERINAAVVKLYFHILSFLTLAKSHLGVGTMSKCNPKTLVPTMLPRFIRQNANLAANLQESTSAHRLPVMGPDGVAFAIPNSELSERGAKAVISAMDEIQQMRAAQTLDTILDWLGSSSFQHKHDPPEMPTTGTTAWFYSHPTVSSWIHNAESTRILYMEGLPGCGKSVLAASFADQLEKQLGVTILALVKPERRVFLVIDAFDDCHFDNAKTMKDGLEKLDRLTSESKVAIAVFTRARPERLLSAAPFLRLPLKAGLLASDIEIFSAELFETLDINPELRDRIFEKIGSQANGSFLWAKMFLLYLAEPGPAEEVLRRLDSCPPGITEVYDVMLKDAVLASASNAQSREAFIVNRRQVFRLICEARNPLSLPEVARALGYDSWNTGSILKLAKPLVSVSDDGRVQLVHPSVREFLTDQSRRRFIDENETVFLSVVDCHNDLAKSCLDCLLDLQYASPKLIGQYLHQNFGATLDSSETTRVPDPSKGVSFDYAAKYWDFHLTSIQDPGTELLELAVSFIQGFQFVFWSEWSFKALGSIARASTVWSKLKSWVFGLPEDKQRLIHLSDYFTYPYNALTSFYWDSRDADQELPWLAQMRLGRFYVDVARTDEANRIRKEVRDGLIELLGTRNPLTLQARTDFALSLTVGGQYLDALAELRDIVDIERDVLGKKSPELFRAEMAMGEVELYLNKFADSAATQKRAAIGFMELYGMDSKQYLSAQLWYCYPLIETNQLDKALDILQLIWNKRREEYGAGDLFAASAQYSIGVIQHKQGQQVEGIKNLREAFQVRHQLVPLTSFWAMDFAIGLLVAYRDFGRRSEAAALLRELDEKGSVGTYFNRYCQVTHVRGLLLWDRGKWNDAIKLLQGLQIGASRDQYNRALLWLALDLALMLRKRGNKDDAQQAESLFDGILVDLERQHQHPAQIDNESSDDDDGDEPSSPRLLKLAETALTLTRNQKFDEVNTLFKEEKVAWYRDEDLWLWAGGPAADTGSLKPPLRTVSANSPKDVANAMEQH